MSDKYLEIYNTVSTQHPDFLDDLHQEIDDFIADQDVFNSRDAVRFILTRWRRRSEWQKICGRWSSSVAGFELCDYLKDEWDITPDPRGGKTYRRK